MATGHGRARKGVGTDTRKPRRGWKEKMKQFPDNNITLDEEERCGGGRKMEQGGRMREAERARRREAEGIPCGAGDSTSVLPFALQFLHALRLALLPPPNNRDFLRCSLSFMAIVHPGAWKTTTMTSFPTMASTICPPGHCCNWSRARSRQRKPRTWLPHNHL